MNVLPVSSLTNNKIPIHDRVMDALQRAQVSSENNNLDGEHGFDGQEANSRGQENGYGQYNNLNTLGSNLNSRYGGKGQHQFFILPEFQQFQHTLKRLNPQLISRLTEQNHKESAK